MAGRARLPTITGGTNSTAMRVPRMTGLPTRILGSMVMRPSFYKGVGLSPWKADIVVVKNFFPFLMFFLPYNRKTLFVRTSGTTDFDAAFQLQFDGPMHPRDVVEDWRPRDRMRRGLDTDAPIEASLHA